MYRLARRTVGVCALLVLAAPLAALGGTFMRWEVAHSGLPLDGSAAVQEVAAGGVPLTVCAIVKPGGLWLSPDEGKTWQPLKGDAPCLASPHVVAVAPDDGKVICAASPGTGLWCSRDRGRTWAQAAGLASDDLEWVTFYGGDPKLVLAGHQAGSALSVSVDGGRTWMARPLGTAVSAQLPFFVSDTRWFVASRQDTGLMLTTDDSGNTWRKSTGNVGAFAGPLPVVQTGEHFFSSVHHGTNKSTDGGRTWAYAMERHARVIGTLGPLVFREDRAGLYGEDRRVLTVAMSRDYANSWEDVTCALVDLVAPDRRQHVVVDNKVDPYAHVRFATAWASTPDGQTGFLALGKAGLFRGRLMWTKGGPLLGDGRLTPATVLEGDSSAPVAIQVSAAAKFGRLTRAFADTSSLGGGELPLFDDGKHEDGGAGDRIYGNTFRVAKGIGAGSRPIGLIAEDDQGRLNSTVVRLKVASEAERKIVWDGDRFAHGLGWASPQQPFIFVKPQTEEAHSGKVALEFHGDGSGWMGGGWNWHGWYPDNAGTDITAFQNLSFWVKLVGDDPGGINVSLNNSSTKQATQTVGVQEYCRGLHDGKWHEVVIPLVDIYRGSKGYDPRKMWELGFDSWSPKARRFSLYIDDIGFDNRRTRPHSVWVRLPEEREATPVSPEARKVAATVDVAAKGTPISPWIYGVAMADRALAREMGISMLRAGGNPVTPFNWKKGFGAKGADWFYQNEGSEGPPERNWLVAFHQENKKEGFETFLTLPMMGRVAKDGTSAAFDTRRYPDQTSWAGQSQPTDRLPHAGGGIQFVRDNQGKFVLDEKGEKQTRPIEANPDDTSVEMSPEEQAEMLRFMIEKMGYGTAGKGGIRCIALDNEPFLWHATHRGMRPTGCSYDELWDRTRTYASLLKGIDPDVQIACGTFFGWTAYFYSGLDSQLVGQGKGTWDDPPDHVAHGRVPVTQWLLRKLAEHEKKTGQRLVDILDWHFYPQTGIYMAGTPGDPKVMQHRVDETRVLWDPTWKDPSWMGKETGKVIQLIRLMKQWVAECNPGMKTAIGEYNFGGDADMSGAIAQAEVLGIFAREGLDFGFYWFAPAPNSPSYFAFKMFRNPDGKHTAFGDRCLPVRVDAPNAVSVHAASDSRTGRLTVIVINKSVAQDARVALALSKPLTEQSVVVYEYSQADRFAIGQLPARKLAGASIAVDAPAFSILRFDLKP